MCDYTDDDEWSDEQLVYELAHQDQQEGKERDGDKIQALIDECLFREILVPCNDRGNGWRLLDMDGVSLMPAQARDCVLPSKGLCCIYWMAQGQPHGSRMYCISDPVAEMGHLKAEEAAEGPHLRVVKNDG